MQGTRGAAVGIGDATQCQAVVVSCIDYRFVEPMRRFLAGHGLTGAVDIIAWPGGAADESARRHGAAMPAGKR